LYKKVGGIGSITSKLLKTGYKYKITDVQICDVAKSNAVIKLLVINLSIP